MPSTRSKAKSITDANGDSNKSLSISGVTKPTMSSTKSPPKSAKDVAKVSPEAKSYVAAVKGGKTTRGGRVLLQFENCELNLKETLMQLRFEPTTSCSSDSHSNQYSNPIQNPVGSLVS